jgi:hypothetical protein
MEKSLWHQTTSIQNDADVRAWLGVLEALTPEQLERAAQGEAYETGSMRLADKLWMLEADEPEASRDWKAVDRLLIEVGETAKRLKLSLLEACAQRGRLVVLGQYQHQIGAALEVAEQALSVASDDPRTRFLLLESIGRQCLYAERHEDAARYLRQSLEQKTKSYALTRFHALLALGCAVGASEPGEASRLIESAIELAKSIAGIPETELIKAFGELSISRWRADGVSTSFTSLDEGARRLFACKPYVPGWRELFAIFEHVSGYLDSLSATGKPPDATPGDERHEAPAPGIFISDHRHRQEPYRPERKCWLHAQLAMFADALEQDDRAGYWAACGINAARGTGQPMVETLLKAQVVADLMVRDSFGKALQTSLGAPAFEMMAMLSLVVRIAHIWLGDKDLAKRHASEAAEICRRLVSSAAAGASWNTAAEILEQSYIQPSVEHLRRTGGDPTVHVMLQCAARVGASVQEDQPLEQVLAQHISVSMFAVGMFMAEGQRPLRPIYRRLFLPFLAEYWQRAIKERAFHFRAPATVKEGLAAAMTAPPERRAQAILDEVASGLDATFGKPVYDWFRGNPPSR